MHENKWERKKKRKKNRGKRNWLWTEHWILSRLKRYEDFSMVFRFIFLYCVHLSWNISHFSRFRIIFGLAQRTRNVYFRKSTRRTHIYTLKSWICWMATIEMKKKQKKNWNEMIVQLFTQCDALLKMMNVGETLIAENVLISQPLNCSMKFDDALIIMILPSVLLEACR